MPARLNIAVFASGKGSNFKAILEAINSGSLPNSHIVLVISNNAEAGALVTAREQGIPAMHVSRSQFGSDDEFNIALLALLHHHGANFIVLAGYLKLVDKRIIQTFRGRIVNIHPALLPAFGGRGMYGMKVHEAVIKAGVPKSGATVHIVDEEYDRGPIVLQKEVQVAEGETPESLAAKVLEIEHQLYPEALRLFAEGHFPLDGEHGTSMKSQ